MMSLSNSTIKKAKEIIDDLNKKYNDEGNFNREYYDELEKDAFSNKPAQKKLDEFNPQKTEQVQAPMSSGAGTQLLIQRQKQLAERKRLQEEDAARRAAQHTLVREKPVVEEKPVKSVPQIMNDRREKHEEAKLGQKQPEVQPQQKVEPKPEVAPQAPVQAPQVDISEKVFAQYPDLKGIVKPSSEPIKNNWNKKALEYIERGDIKPEQVPLLKVILPKINSVHSVAEYFSAVRELRMNDELKALDPKGDILRHFVNSANLHIKMGDEVKNEIGRLLQERIGQAGFGQTKMGELVMNVLKKIPAEASIKDLGALIGKEIAPHLGDISMPPKTQEEKMLREDALKINGEIYRMLGTSTGLSLKTVKKSSGVFLEINRE